MVLVFGSINIDLVVPVPRWPAPGETVLGGEYRLLPGGKGANQALAARRAGAETALAGAVGEDAFAETALGGLRAAGVDLCRVSRVAQPTGCAAILVTPEGENRILVSPGANAAAEAAAVPDAALGPGITLLLQMEVPAAENAALIGRARARAHGARIMLNLAPALPIEAGALGAVAWLLVNEREAASLGEARQAAGRVRQGLVLTRGAAGAVAYLAASGEFAVPALPIVPVDTTGAGDVFAGVFAAALDRGLDPRGALRRASTAASLACLAPGAQSAVPDAAAIDSALSRLPER